MHLLAILAFTVVFWRAETPGGWALVGEDDLRWTLACALAQPALMALAAWLTVRRGKRLLAQYGDEPEIAQHFHHWQSFLLRTAALLVFSGTVFLTRWSDWFDFTGISPALQIAGDLIVLTPFMATIVVFWVVTYPLERALRSHGLPWSTDGGSEADGGWRFSSYLDFHVRHYLLVVSIPMTVILFGANMTREYETQLQTWSGWFWTPDVLLGAVAAGMFVVAPVMLRRIWRTVPLEPGPVRDRLESLCERIGLRCREILMWKSDGIMINAAVMGVCSPMRYVLLSDALLATMNPRQIEAVFGHEAGHVRHHHIQHFLVFAVVGWVMVACLMEMLALAAIGLNAPREVSARTIEAVGVAATILIWGIGFGWLSRRFERQADVFGARCAAPSAAECGLPCSVHPDERTTLPHDRRICSTGAALFASALDRVAALNGIPQEERSWRHSSIGSRIRFLTSLAGDPRRAEGFDRLIRLVKTVMFLIAAVGSAATIYYWMLVPEPAILRLQAGEL